MLIDVSIRVSHVNAKLAPRRRIISKRHLRGVRVSPPTLINGLCARSNGIIFTFIRMLSVAAYVWDVRGRFKSEPAKYNVQSDPSKSFKRLSGS